MIVFGARADPLSVLGIAFWVCEATTSVVVQNTFSDEAGQRYAHESHILGAVIVFFMMHAQAGNVQYVHFQTYIVWQTSHIFRSQHAGETVSSHHTR